MPIFFSLSLSHSPSLHLLHFAPRLHYRLLSLTSCFFFILLRCLYGFGGCLSFFSLGFFCTRFQSIFIPLHLPSSPSPSFLFVTDGGWKGVGGVCCWVCEPSFGLPTHTRVAHRTVPPLGSPPTPPLPSTFPPPPPPAVASGHPFGAPAMKKRVKKHVCLGVTRRSKLL